MTDPTYWKVPLDTVALEDLLADYEWAVLQKVHFYPSALWDNGALQIASMYAPFVSWRIMPMSSFLLGHKLNGQPEYKNQKQATRLICSHLYNYYKKYAQTFII